MQIIQFSETFKSLNRFIKTHNAGVDGLGKRVGASMTLTAQEIVKLYARLLAIGRDLDALDKDNLPPLRTNNAQLAERCNCSTRTIKRHLIRLQTAGIITGKHWRGSDNCFELWINTEFLWLNQLIFDKKPKNQKNVPGEQTAHTAQNESFEKEGGTDCPHYEKGYFNKREINNIIRSVDNSDGIVSEAGAFPSEVGIKNRHPHARTGLHDRNGDLKGHAGEKGFKNDFQDATGKLWAGATREAVSEDSGAGRSAFLYAMELWEKAKISLYSDTHLTAWQEKEAQRLIPKFYETVPLEKLRACHQVYLERVEMVRAYLQRSPDRFVPLPHKYFDRDNPNGFTGTKKWWEDRRRLKKENWKNKVLKEQVAKIAMGRLGLGENKEPLLTQYLRCEQRIARFKDPELMDRFHQKVLSPATYERVSMGRRARHLKA